MTFKHKLSMRLALLRGAMLTGLALPACTDQRDPLGPDAATDSTGGIGSVLPTNTMIGDRVRASVVAYLRTEPRVSSALAGTQPIGAMGTIVAGPIVDTAGDGLTRYQIDFDSGVDGWGSAPYLDRVGTSPAATVTLTPSPVTVGVGATVALQATVRDAAGHLLAGRTIAYASTDTLVARISASGAVTGVATGLTTVRATVEGRTGVDTVRVGTVGFAVGARVRATEVAYIRSTGSVSGTLLGQQPIGAEGTILEGPVVDAAGDGLRRWRVDFATGVDGWAAEPYIAVVTGTPAPAPAPTAASIDVTPATASLVAGATTQLTATVRDGNGTVMSGVSTSWTSRDTTRVRISSTGLATAIAAGATWVVATTGTVRDSAAISVTAPSTPAPAPTVRVGYYVAANGSAVNDGSYARPWDLSTALSGASGRIRAGDTVWVRGGTYRGTYRSTVAGTSGRPVVIRAYPGERATIDHSGSSVTTLSVQGAWSVFWGLEVTNSNTTRYTSSTASEQRPNGVVNGASNVKFINMVVHDAGVGFYNYPHAANVEIAGSIFYNNGWAAPDRGHGHGTYLKSDVGPVVLRDNVLFNQFGYGVHVYSNQGDGRLINIRIEGNTAFNNGTLANNSNSENILVGGDDYSTGGAVVNNLTYFTPGRGGRNVRLGFESLVNGTMSVSGNLFAGGSPVLDLGFWTTISMNNNTFVGASQVLRQNSSLLSGLTWTGNTVRRDPTSASWYALGAWRTFSAWRLATGLGLTDNATASAPTGSQVFVKPSAYEAGRALVTVYDWSRTGSVNVALGAVLNAGDRYEVRSVQGLFGAPIASGTYGGSITLPMGVSNPPAPIGGSAAAAPRTGAEFDVFLVTRVP